MRHRIFRYQIYRLALLCAFAALGCMRALALNYWAFSSHRCVVIDYDGENLEFNKQDGATDGWYHIFALDYGMTDMSIDDSKAVQAQAQDGYRFLGWYTKKSGWGNGQPTVATATDLLVSSSELSYAKLQEAGVGYGRKVVVAKYIPIYTILTEVSPYGAGTVTGAGTYDEGASVSLRATAATGYSFKEWRKGDTAVSSDATYSFTVSAAGMYTAVFTGMPYSVGFNANGGTGSMASTNFAYDADVLLPSNRFSRTGYSFAGWATNENESAVYADKALVSNIAAPGGSCNLYAAWDPIHYTIKFNAGTGYGEKMSDIQAIYGVDITLPSNTFENAGYSFSVWNVTPGPSRTCNDGATVNNLTSEAGGEVTLTAHWIPNHYTIAFDGNGATSGSMANESATYGTTIALNENRYAKTGYAFDGWALSSNATEVAYGDKAQVAGLTAENNATSTLYAVWSPISYSIVFKPNSGSGEMENLSATYDSPTNLPANAFTRTGYLFAGWATSSTGEKIYDDCQAVTNLASAAGAAVNLYAKWSAIEYDIAFDGNGGTGDMAPTNAVYDSPLYLPSNCFARVGYTFSGWALSPGATSADYGDKARVSNLATGDGDTATLYAVWSANNYTVRYRSNGGSGTMNTSAATYDAPLELTQNAFVKTGYSFGGWATNAAADAAVFVDGDTVSNLTTVAGAIFDLYAFWTTNSYTIAFGGGEGGEGEMSSVTAAYDTETVLPSNKFTRTGYHFYRWGVSGSSQTYLDGATVKNLADSGIVTLTAQWTANKYTIAFDGNGANYGSMASKEATYDKSLQLNANSFVRYGYAFDGWATTSSGVVAYANNGSVENLTTENNATSTLYAVWSPISYTIAFKANGGGGEMEDIHATYDSPTNLPANAFTRTGYLFAGWASSSSATVAEYADQAFVSNLVTAANSTKNLYAVWANNTYKISFNANGGSGSSMSATNAEYGVDFVLPTNKYTKVGYQFAGWSTVYGVVSADYADGATISRTAGSGDLVLYAQWSAIPYVIAFDANGGEGEMDPLPVAYDAPENLTPNVFTRTAFKFSGWALSSSGVVAYADQAPVSNLTTIANSTQTLYAVWSDNTYSISFDKNGGEGTMPTTNAIYGVGFRLPANAFERYGYLFGGWATSSAGEKIYDDCQTVTDLGPSTLYAVWRDNQYTIHLNANGGKGKMDDVVAIRDVPTNLTANVFTRTGYTFLGWATTPSATSEDYADGALVLNLAAATETAILYAVWGNSTDNPYSIAADCDKSGGGKILLELMASTTVNSGIVPEESGCIIISNATDAVSGGNNQYVKLILPAEDGDKGNAQLSFTAPCAGLLKCYYKVHRESEEPDNFFSVLKGSEEVFKAGYSGSVTEWTSYESLLNKDDLLKLRFQSGWSEGAYVLIDKITFTAANDNPEPGAGDKVTVASASVSSGVFLLSFTGNADFDYELWANDDLSDAGGWKLKATKHGGASVSFSCDIAPGEPQMFYRIDTVRKSD